MHRKRHKKKPGRAAPLPPLAIRRITRFSRGQTEPKEILAGGASESGGYRFSVALINKRMRPVRRLYRVCQTGTTRSFRQQRERRIPRWSPADPTRRLPLAPDARLLPAPLPSRGGGGGRGGGGTELPQLSLASRPFGLPLFVETRGCIFDARSRLTGRRGEDSREQWHDWPGYHFGERSRAGNYSIIARAIIRYSVQRARRTENEEGKRDGKKRVETRCPERASFTPHHHHPPAPPRPAPAKGRITEKLRDVGFSSGSGFSRGRTINNRAARAQRFLKNSGTAE